MLLNGRLLAMFSLICLLSAGGAKADEPNNNWLVLLSQHHLLGTQVPSEVLDHAELIDIVAPMWYETTDTGQVQPREFTDAGVKDYIAAMRNAGLRVMPIVRNFSPQPKLANPEAIDRSMEGIIALSEELGVDGLVIDYEHLNRSSRESYVQFITRLHRRMQAADRMLIIAVAARAWENELDYKALSENSDYLYVMFYDYTGPWKMSDGPTAPLTWPDNNRDIQRDLARILATGAPANKLLFGLATYGGDWTLNDAGDPTALNVQYIETIHENLRRHNAEEQWDEQRQSPFAEYSDSEGRRHRVWYENERSYRAKLAFAREQGLAGVAIWVVRYPDRISSQALWTTLAQPPETPAAEDQ